jgi:cation diffusion facilitator CzcD-associated flavoprotein CzcO
MADGNLDLVIVGAGFAGMYMLHPARAMRLSARVFDAVVQKCAEAAASYQSFALS